MNGTLVPWRDAKAHVLTHALHYASSVFEGERSYSGKVFKLEEHTERLFASAKLLDMEIPYTRAELNAAQVEVLRANNITDEYPDKIAPSASTPIYALTNSLIDGQVYPRSGGPFGMNGRFYYTRLRVTF